MNGKIPKPNVPEIMEGELFKTLLISLTVRLNTIFEQRYQENLA